MRGEGEKIKTRKPHIDLIKNITHIKLLYIKLLCMFKNGRKQIRFISGTLNQAWWKEEW